MLYVNMFNFSDKMEDVEMNQDKIFITGTDTGIGKTVLSLLIMRLFYEIGKTPFYIKPAQTGCKDPYDNDSDAKFVYDNLPVLNGKDPAESVIYCFRNPKAPHFAARDEGRRIEIEKISNVIEKKRSMFSPIIIEGAGGVMAPLTKEMTMIDMINKVGANSIVAARAGLGTINHTCLTVEALEKRNIKIKGIIFIDSTGKTPFDMVQENIEAVETETGIKVAGVINKITDFFNPGEKNMKTVANLVNGYRLSHN